MRVGLLFKDRRVDSRRVVCLLGLGLARGARVGVMVIRNDIVAYGRRSMMSARRRDIEIGKSKPDKDTPTAGWEGA